MAYTKARAKANKKWDSNNRERKNYINKRSVAKNFILKSATQEDLDNIKQYIKQREEMLSQEEWKESHSGLICLSDFFSPLKLKFMYTCFILNLISARK